MSIDRVKQLLTVQLPGPQPTILLYVGSLAWRGLSLYRKFRLYRNPVNAAALGVGHAIEFTMGNRPGVKEIARFMFLSLSIAKCAEDLIELKTHLNEFKGHFTGKSYVKLLHDPCFELKQWSFMGPRFDASWFWIRRVGFERVRMCAWLIVSIVHRMGSLVVHLGDAHAALTEDHVSAVVVHGHMLWKKLSGDDEILVQELRSTKAKSDGMLKSLNLPFSTEIFIKVLLAPAEAKARLPDLTDVKRSVKSVLTEGKMRVIGTMEVVLNVDPSLRTMEVAERGMDAESLKYLNPPIRVDI